MEELLLTYFFLRFFLYFVVGRYILCCCSKVGTCNLQAASDSKVPAFSAFSGFPPQKIEEAISLFFFGVGVGVLEAEAVRVIGGIRYRYR